MYHFLWVVLQVVRSNSANTSLKIGETQRLASIGARQDLGQALNRIIEIVLYEHKFME
ncbi:hypothetical protein LEP1GSC013_3286 [Leptospira interrogans serovar Valbuzzi str. Duyster]|uniref:hypothetical protein n=1 Tax=Leptospira interrogans TaxID=173 RepID=UPI0002BDC2AB|nr:hypothetical protein [Leptospira interrogans]EMJ57098.1 hypothetical protein LEP1GSC013_3286 [Leptospira interrogans serovar Valbuzzi str. Duyster]ENO70550.1 hypothetical protein LEP1GSC012_4161 [Leptospira interrogans serovar Valbuzzi str. Valbuzzi]